jgi:hypothetical protein
MQNLIFSTEAAKSSMKSSARRINIPGIHENVTMKSIEIGKSPNSGSEFMEFRFEKEDGAYQLQRVWAPNLDNLRVNDGETEAEAAQREVNGKLQHIQHVLDTYLPSNQSTIVAGSYSEFCDIAKRRLDPAIKDVTLRIKLLMDSEGQYVQFPRFTPYIEKQVEGQSSRLFITDWEKQNRMTKAEPKSETNGAIIGGPTNNDTSSDLPF